MVTDLTDSAVKLAIRPWATNDDYGIVCSETLENCKIQLYNEGIDIQPFLKETSK